MSRTVAFILKGYPRLSETFIAQEIEELEKRGLDVSIFSLRMPPEGHIHAVHDRIRAEVVYLPEYISKEPLRCWRAYRNLRRYSGYRKALWRFLRDFVRDPTANRARRFGQALVMADELKPNVKSLHAHFLHTPASVAQYVSLLTGLEWSCSAHAKDIWTTPDWDKKEKVAAAKWVVVCSKAGLNNLLNLIPDHNTRRKIFLAYHGLDLSQFIPFHRKLSPRDGKKIDDPVKILSVGRAVEKKGFEDLIDALKVLPKCLHWRLIHIGDGPLIDKLKSRAKRVGLAAFIEWSGALNQKEVLAACRSADIFVLASRTAANGDKDGLPNVLVEAQSQGLPCLSTDVSAISELIEDGRTGLLVDERDINNLADQLARLIQGPELRQDIGSAGQKRVVENFSLTDCITEIAARFDV